jgi:hypothetical protein
MSLTLSLQHFNYLFALKEQFCGEYQQEMLILRILGTQT